MDKNKLFSEPWSDYELIDAGGGKKLERFGKFLLIRPEVQAYFKSATPFYEWRKMAHWEFVEAKGGSGKWKVLNDKAVKQWQIQYQKLCFQLELTKFKHIGIFPEQRSNWDWISERLKSENRFLNLFAYTGAASCVSRYIGAETVHVDSVKQVLSWAKHNMDLSKLLNIKWVHEDALKFAERERKRGNKYNMLVMDPPAWGIGAKGEKWRLEDSIDQLIFTASELLEENGHLLMNTYSPKVDNTLIKQIVEVYFPRSTHSLHALYIRSSAGNELYFGNVLRLSKESH